MAEEAEERENWKMENEREKRVGFVLGGGRREKMYVWFWNERLRDVCIVLI